MREGGRERTTDIEREIEGERGRGRERMREREGGRDERH